MSDRDQLPDPTDPIEAKASEVEAPEAVILPEPEPEPVPTPASKAPPKRSSGFLGLLMGGAVAALIGFGLARFVVPEGWPMGNTASLNAVVAEQTARLATMADELAALKADLATRPSAGDLTALQTRLDTPLPSPAVDPALVDRLTQAEQRIEALELRPTAEGGVAQSAIDAVQREMQALRDQIATFETADQVASAEAQAALAQAQAQAETIRAEAEALVRKAKREGAIAAIRTAFDSGQPFDAALADLTAAGVTIPAPLAAVAQGVPTPLTLQETFPEAARLALDAALRTDMGETVTDRMTSFLRAQTGARSLTPRDGADPDAILSRMEAAVRAHDLAAAVPMAAELPAPAVEALATWLAAAQTRLDAETALATLATASE